MSSPLANPWIQYSYRRQYRGLLGELNVRDGQSVLDIGSGMGFLKPMVIDRGAVYTGIEADGDVFDIACRLYGPEGFRQGYFPDVACDRQYDVILALSCVDEVPDKEKFLRGVCSSLVKGTGVCYVAVRNRAFFVNRFKTERLMAGRSARSRVSLTDLTAQEWETLFGACGFSIIEKGKFWRPWITGFSSVGLRNVAYRMVSMIVPREYSHMLSYKLKVN